MSAALHLLPAIVCGAAAFFLAMTLRDDLATGTLPWRSCQMAAGAAFVTAATAGAAISAWHVLAAVIREAAR